MSWQFRATYSDGSFVCKDGWTFVANPPPAQNGKGPLLVDEFKYVEAMRHHQRELKKQDEGHLVIRVCHGFWNRLFRGKL